MVQVTNTHSPVASAAPEDSLANDVRILREAISADLKRGPWLCLNLGPAYPVIKVQQHHYGGFGSVAHVPHDALQPYDQAVATADFIAACSPDRIARLLDRLAQLEERAQPSAGAVPSSASEATAPAGPSADLASYIARADAAAQAAARSCGQSDVLFDSYLQPALAGILEDAPADLRAQLEPELRRRGFDPDHVPYEPGPDECGTTGIHVHHCPCGRHE